MAVPRVRPAGPLFALALGGSVFACVDLFHSTRDFVDECVRDAAAPGCPPGAAFDAGGAGEAVAPDAAAPLPDFCSWSPDAARAAAERSCAWLGACASPLGNNAYGRCMVQALLAFDCGANPNHPAHGAARDRWACLAAASAGAAGCDAVRRCVFPAGEPGCPPSAALGCTDPSHGSVRTECFGDAGAPPAGENCALAGKLCVFDGGVASCGSTGLGLACDGTQPAACESGPLARLHWCGPDGADIGIDCASNGAQRCQAYPPDAASWTACVPSVVGDASCTPSTDSVTCTNGVATSCPAGVPETIDCASLLGSPDACSSAPLSPAFDWTSPCRLGAAAPVPDRCDGSTLTATERGALFSLPCDAVGLGPCRLVPTALGTELHAACTPP